MTTEAYEQLERDGNEEKAKTEETVSGWEVQPLPGRRDTDSAPFDQPKTYQETEDREGRRSTRERKRSKTRNIPSQKV